jgi:hypothetical protein
MNCDEINSIVENQFCDNTLQALSDSSCLEKFKQCESLKNKISRLDSVLFNNFIREEQRKKIINEYTVELISPGLKAVIRGNKFNEIVKNHILSLNLDSTIYDTVFEKKAPIYETSEIPDWYILEKKTNRLMIGMNQLDLWGGGQQLNRASKYILNFPDNSESLRLVSVVANRIRLTSDKNKAFKIFQKGFQTDTLCYIKNLKLLIHRFFS